MSREELDRRLDALALRCGIAGDDRDELGALLAEALRAQPPSTGGLIADPVTLSFTGGVTDSGSTVWLEEPEGSASDQATLRSEGLRGAAEGGADGPRFGRYADLGPIGRGGMGSVWRVRDGELNRTMAMKVIHPEGLFTEHTVARFVEEAQVTAQLEHPGIVPVHEIGRLPDGRLYFTMQEVRGRTLADVIDEVHQPRGRPSPGGGGWFARWTFRRLVDAFLTVCESVAYAHSRGVVHRDIKPSNIMVGAFGEVRVLDWGLARVLGRQDRAAEAGALGAVEVERREAHMTRQGAVAGTPMFMPPEQARGELDALGPPSDVYSLGAVLFVILTGRMPHGGRTTADVLTEVRAGRVAPLKGRLPIPDELAEICLRAMSPAPADRFADAAALAAEIAAWLEGQKQRERALQTVAEADAVLPRMEGLRDQARRLREEAARLLGPVAPQAPVDEKRPAWEREDEAVRLEREAALAGLSREQALRAALNLAPDLPEAHDRLAALYQAQHARAEERRDATESARCEALLRTHDRGRFAAWLRGEGALSLETDPPGAEATLFRYDLRDRRLVTLFLRAGRFGRGGSRLGLGPPPRAFAVFWFGTFETHRLLLTGK